MQISIIFALKRKNVAHIIPSAEVEADLKTLIQIIQAQWQYEVCSQAVTDLNIKKLNKVTIVPLANDLKLLKEYLISKANLSITALKNPNSTQNDYVVLMETIFCRLILLNPRRPGELQRLLLDTYVKADTNNSSYEEFSDV